MKKLLIISVLSVLALAGTSCKRCLTCSYVYKPAGTSLDSTINVPQECGVAKNREAYENSVRSEAALVGGVVTCEE